MKITYLDFKKNGDDRGSLTAIEQNKDVPFDIKRIYYIYETKKNVRRGFHAHKALQQVLICVTGSCKILLDDGSERQIVELNKINKGLYIGPGIWREMYDFSSDAILLVLASEKYDEEDYIRNYEDFIKLIREGEKHV